jgi:3-isopropylmalate/(R)-2-methylmalate dehydratase small subunit
MSGRVWKFGDGIDTDAMAPGQYMKLPVEQLAQHCLASLRPEFAKDVREDDVLVAGTNFGVGSSREQAPQALRLLGIRYVLAKSFAGIFYRNAFNLGLAVMICPQAYTIPDGAQVLVDPLHGSVTLPEQGLVLQCEPVPSFLLEIVNDGGLLPHLKKRVSLQAGSTTAR